MTKDRLEADLADVLVLRLEILADWITHLKEGRDLDATMDMGELVDEMLALVKGQSEPEPATTSWAPHVRTRGETDWTKNGLRFATREEAEGWAADLGGRWTAVEETGAVQTLEPVNYRFDCVTRVLERLSE